MGKLPPKLPNQISPPAIYSEWKGKPEWVSGAYWRGRADECRAIQIQLERAAKSYDELAKVADDALEKVSRQ